MERYTSYDQRPYLEESISSDRGTKPRMEQKSVQLGVDCFTRNFWKSTVIMRLLEHGTQSLILAFVKR